MKQASAQDIDIRPFVDTDSPAVLDLLTAAMGGGPAGRRLPEFFQWKHIDNPFGRSFMLVACAEDRIIGLRAFMRWRFRAEESTVEAVRAVDTATHPEFQGGGIFSRLTLAALDELRGHVDLVFNTPNEKSLPGYLKMGWRTVGRVPVWIRPRRPIRVARRFRASSEPSNERFPVDAMPAAEAIDDARVGALLAEAAIPAGRFATPRDQAFLAWRYGAAPVLDYRAVRVEDGPALKGLGIFRARGRGGLREATVTDVIARPGDHRTIRRLLRAVSRAASVDHLTCRFPFTDAPGRLAASAGFVRAPGGVTLVTNPLHERITPDPASASAWGLTVGDLEVF
jgi:hypothetical protein